MRPGSASVWCRSRAGVAAPPAQGAGMRHGQLGRMGTGSASPSPCATQDPRRPQPKPGLVDLALRALAAPVTPRLPEPDRQRRGRLGRAGTRLVPSWRPDPAPIPARAAAPAPALLKYFYNRQDQSTRNRVCAGLTARPLPETPRHKLPAHPSSPSRAHSRAGVQHHPPPAPAAANQ